MRLLGINKGETLTGKKLRFGGAAVFNDGEVIAISEERVCGVKYAGGYHNALRLISDATGLDPASDFDSIAVSTCCESDSAGLDGHELAHHPNLVAVQHHLSHAALAFYGSEFDNALVVVADGGGNTLSDTAQPSPQWWREPREQSSYYLGAGKTLRLVATDFQEAHAVGFGEIYRAFTYFLGWHSSTHASKTMALAGHGDRKAFSADLFAFDDDRVFLPIDNEPDDPIGMIQRLGRVLGADFGEPRAPGEAILRIHRDVAAFVQEGVERALCHKLVRLSRELGVTKLCLAGGLANNVVLNGRLLDVFPGGVYIPSAPGDEGQCLGNVYAVLHALGETSQIRPVIRSKHAYMGPTVKIDSACVASELKRSGLGSYVVFETTDFSTLIARFLAAGSLACIYQPRSEYGPRALGSRSILADPRRASVAAELNTLKRRDWFMPFAPTVLRSRLHEWFEPVQADSHVRPHSPFMSFALRASAAGQAQLPAVVNADGTARVQTVEEDDGTVISGILSSFAELTGVPILLNTSFNLGGEPIVESVAQALQAFKRMSVNVLGIGRFVVVKSLSPALADLPLEGSIEEFELHVIAGDQRIPVETEREPIASVIRTLQHLTDSVVFVRTELPLYGPYLGWLREGRKVTTIRFRKGAVEIPFSQTLPLFKTDDYSPGDRSRPTDYVRIHGIRYQLFGELTHEDAQRDGFADIAQMRHDLKEIYPTLEDDSWVTIYDISLAGKSAHV